MLTVRQTPEFAEWLAGLRDFVGRSAVLARITRIESGNLKSCKSVGEGVLESVIDHGPGYRIYLTRCEQTIYLLLDGGDKSTQQGDIERAKLLKQREAPKKAKR
jgi:putative addiction module killer protein